MTRMINKQKDIVSQVLNGVTYIYKDRLTRIPKTGIVLKKKLVKNKVALISGGGSGHEPAHFGYIGNGMLDGTISGPVFTPPSAKEILEAIQLADQGCGTLLIIKNFEADRTNFLEAQKQAKLLGYKVDHVIVDDDCSVVSDRGEYSPRRRGVAGSVFVHKILGQAAKEGRNLEELVKLGKEVVSSLNTLGVAFSSGTDMETNEPLFNMNQHVVSFGIGIHGEQGYREEVFYSSEHLANELINKLLNQYQDDDRFAVLVNGTGSSTLMEQYIFANDVDRLLKLQQKESAFQLCGEFMTSTDMKGISLSLLSLKEEYWLDYLQADTDAFAWR